MLVIWEIVIFRRINLDESKEKSVGCNRYCNAMTIVKGRHENRCVQNVYKTFCLSWTVSKRKKKSELEKEEKLSCLRISFKASLSFQASQQPGYIQI